MSSLKDKTSEICSNTSRSKLEKDILKSYLDEQIKLLLDRINLLYPKQFKKGDLKKEWKNYQKWKPTIKLTEPDNKKTQTSKMKKTQMDKNKKNSTSNQVNIPPDEKRCIARVFDINKIIYQNNTKSNNTKSNNTKSNNTKSNNIKSRNTKTKTQYKTNSSKVVNANLLNIIKKDPNAFTFGRQCYGKKCGDSNYCFVHKRNNPHGDFNNSLSLHLKEHFIKMFKTFN